MTRATAGKPFGIRVELPDNDPMSAPHLLGDKWSSVRWYDTESARDSAFEQMLKQPGYYREGDTPSVRLSKIRADQEQRVVLGDA
ncbi:MAG: hypothetical protein HKN42_12355 [Granulosicoccus sp.]|nr:hypothetical protein [Granulosicoccus sp.]